MTPAPDASLTRPASSQALVRPSMTAGTTSALPRPASSQALARPHSSPALPTAAGGTSDPAAKHVMTPLEMRDIRKHLGLGACLRTHPSSFDLRQVANRRKKCHPEPARTSSSPLQLRKKKTLGPTTQIDLLGGNGAWRQKKAEVEFEERRIEEEERLRLQAIRDEERRKREAEKEARRRQHLREEEQRRKDEKERLRREAEEKEHRRKEEDDRKHRIKEEEEREWQRRQPKTCEVCAGQAKCKTCDGKGYSFAMFLVPTVDTNTLMTHGRVMQGCQDCGGYRHNILGSLKKGTGLCRSCDGVGKITPKIDAASVALHRKRLANLSTTGGSLDLTATFVSMPSVVVA
eukprot:TRINITY_DN6115_c0_g1_i1.p1 TRINITY_DN6115_c0_g1~~TRINITY_DN6115_c0_g1_i1.p1  ORF type:complete len:347 (-),score=95.36 TRINITY_DN6115_c0_g1_i1:348-1388(-)